MAPQCSTVFVRPSIGPTLHCLTPNRCAASLSGNAGTLAKRFQDVALHLADAIDGLSGNRPFRNPHDTRMLFTPSGVAVALIPFPVPPVGPLTIQTVLRLLAVAR